MGIVFQKEFEHNLTFYMKGNLYTIYTNNLIRPNILNKIMFLFLICAFVLTKKTFINVFC